MNGGPLFQRSDRVVAVRRESNAHAASWRSVVLRDPCPYCCLSPKADFGKQRMTTEHVVPLSLGGSNLWENVVAAHKGCNEQRSSRALLVFLLYRHLSAGRTKKQRTALRRAFYRRTSWAI